MERHRAVRAAVQRVAPESGTTMTPAGEREVAGPRFPHGMRNA
jgi:hypothetical protein